MSLIARIGDDQAGRAATAELTAQGVDCRFAIDRELATCCVVVLVSPDGERTMLPDRGANAALCPADVELPTHAEPRQHLHLSGYVLLDAGSRPAALRALELAKAAGWTTSVDPQTTGHIREIGADTFLSWLTDVDVLLPNDSELAVLGGSARVLDTVAPIVVTHGVRGASQLGAGAPITVSAPEVHRADSTGAGDAFNAGWLAAGWPARPPADALRAGVAAGHVSGRTGGCATDLSACRSPARVSRCGDRSVPTLRPLLVDDVVIGSIARS